MSSSEFEIMESDAANDKTPQNSPKTKSQSPASNSDNDNLTSLDDESETEEGNNWKKLKFNKNLEATLKKHGLSKRNVKTIIHSIFKNDTVKEILKSQAQIGEDDDDVNIPEIRWTRSKCKDANMDFKAPWPLSPQKSHFIAQKPKFTELPLPEEDEEDKEYQPREEELLESDGDTQESEDTRPSTPSDVNISASDINTQASNDNILNKLNELDKKLEDNLQKNKQEIESIVYVDSPITDDLISLRTRSKHPLTSTGIDVIEAAFNPPDVTEDMYEPLNVDDYDWQKWLSDLFKDSARLNSSTISHEDEDSETDPDFNYLAEDMEVDKEDLRSDCAVRVTKKELNSLMDELNNDPLFDCSTPLSSSIDLNTSTPIRNILAKSKKSKTLSLDDSGELTPCTSGPSDISRNTDIELNKSCEGLALTSKQILSRKRKKGFHKMEENFEPQFTQEQKCQLSQQLQMHVQMLAQTNVLTRHNCEYTYYSKQSQNLLLELQQLALNHSNVKNSGFKACNLDEAVEICSKDIPISEFMTNVPKSLSKRGYFPLSRSIATTMAYSKVFMYVELLPLSSPVEKEGFRTLFFMRPEDRLIALSMEEFSSMCNDFATLAHNHYLPTRQVKMIKLRVQNVMTSTAANIEFNPIRMYRTQRKLPMPDATVRYVKDSDVKSPIQYFVKDVVKNYWLESLAKKESLHKSIPEGVPHIPIVSENTPLSLSRLWKVDAKTPTDPNSQRFSLVTLDDDSKVLVPLKAENSGTVPTPTNEMSPIKITVSTSLSSTPKVTVSPSKFENIQCNYIDSSSIYTGITTVDKTALSCMDPLKEHKIKNNKQECESSVKVNNNKIKKSKTIPKVDIQLKPTMYSDAGTSSVTMEPISNTDPVNDLALESNKVRSLTPLPSSMIDLPTIRVGYLDKPLNSVVRQGQGSKVSCSIADIIGSIKVTPRPKQEVDHIHNQIMVPLKKRAVHNSISSLENTGSTNIIDSSKYFESTDVRDWIKTATKPLPSPHTTETTARRRATYAKFLSEVEGITHESIAKANRTRMGFSNYSSNLNSTSTVITNMTTNDNEPTPTGNLDILSLAASCIIPYSTSSSAYLPTPPNPNPTVRGGTLIATTTIDKRSLISNDQYEFSNEESKYTTHNIDTVSEGVDLSTNSASERLNSKRRLLIDEEVVKHNKISSKPHENLDTPPPLEIFDDETEATKTINLVGDEDNYEKIKSESNHNSRNNILEHSANEVTTSSDINVDVVNTDLATKNSPPVLYNNEANKQNISSTSSSSLTSTESDIPPFKIIKSPISKRPRDDLNPKNAENRNEDEVIANIQSVNSSINTKRKSEVAPIDAASQTAQKRKRQLSKECLKVKFRKTEQGFEAEALKHTPIKNKPCEITPNKSLKSNSNSAQFALEEDTMVQLDPGRMAKESLIAESYLKKVQNALKNDQETFISFLEILEKFSNSMEAPSRLFFQLKNLLHKWPNLINGFVPCLMPSQALECKVFKEHRVYAKARKFLRKVEMHFKDDEQQLDRISQVYKELSYEGFYDENIIVAKLLPLVKDNAILAGELSNHFNSNSKNLPKKSCRRSMFRDLPKKQNDPKTFIPEASSEFTSDEVCSRTCLSDVTDISEDALSCSPFKRLSNFPEIDMRLNKIDRPDTPTGLKAAGDNTSIDMNDMEYECQHNDDVSVMGLPVTPGKMPPKKQLNEEWSAAEDQLIILRCRQLGSANKEVFRKVSMEINKDPECIEKRFNFLLTKWNEIEISDSSSSDSE